MLVVRDGVGMAYMGYPFAPYLSLSVFLSRSIDFRKPDGLSWQRFCFGFLQVPPGEAEGRLCVVVLWFLFPSCSSGWRAVVVGHTQAMSCLTRRRSILPGVVLSVSMRPIG